MKKQYNIPESNIVPCAAVTVLCGSVRQTLNVGGSANPSGGR